MSDIDTVVVNSLKTLDPNRPIREADIDLFDHLIGQLRAERAGADQKQEIVKRLRTGPTSADEVDHWAPGTCGRPYNSQERSLCLRRVLVLRRER